LLSDTTRRSILELLAQKEELTYTEIMTLLRITNTGRLNYHLKALGNLLAKDEQGKYHLTEQGKVAVNLLRTFPERVPPPEKKRQSALKITVSIVLILVGILLIASSALAVLAVPTSVSSSSSESGSVSSQVIPSNLTVSLMPWHSTGGNLQIAWSASNPIHIYVFNQTQYDALLLQNSSSSSQGNLENFTGTPTFWVQQYYLQSDNTTLGLSQGQYYFFAGSTNQTVLNSFGVSQSQSPQPQSPGGTLSLSPFLYLWLIILLAVGILFMVLAFSILTHRVWR
jgi:DNA-binding transcriptional ArsR family regulator